MKIIGNKILLRPFEENDAAKILEMRDDIEGIRSFTGSPFPSNLESQKQWILNMYPKGLPNNLYFAIIDKNENLFSGYCVARKIDYINRNAEVGIILHKNSRGKGFFKDVSKTFYSYLFNDINLHKLYSFVLTDNTISIETDKKLGFKVEGIVKEQIFQNGIFKDVFFVSLYKTDFLLLQ